MKIKTSFEGRMIFSVRCFVNIVGKISIKLIFLDIFIWFFFLLLDVFSIFLFLFILSSKSTLFKIDLSNLMTYKTNSYIKDTFFFRFRTASAGNIVIVMSWMVNTHSPKCLSFAYWIETNSYLLSGKKSVLFICCQIW